MWAQELCLAFHPIHEQERRTAICQHKHDLPKMSLQRIQGRLLQRCTCDKRGQQPCAVRAYDL